MDRTDLRSFPTLARGAALGAALALPLMGTAQAQDDFPSGPIEIINMSSPGGGTDIFLRTLAICAQEELGTEIVVLSKTGGLGAAMINYAANRERLAAVPRLPSFCSNGGSVASARSGRSAGTAPAWSGGKAEGRCQVGQGHADVAGCWP